jgi:hypothetical protein
MVKAPLGAPRTVLLPDGATTMVEFVCSICDKVLGAVYEPPGRMVFHGRWVEGAWLTFWYEAPPGLRLADTWDENRGRRRPSTTYLWDSALSDIGDDDPYGPHCPRHGQLVRPDIAAIREAVAESQALGKPRRLPASVT